MNDELLPQSTPPEVLYHYTTQQGLLGITRDREIFATSIRYVNDAAEIVHGLDLADDEIQDLQDTVRAGPRSEESKTRERRLESLWDLLDDMDEGQIFVCSFSEEGDLLSQWRAYSSNTGGISLGFNTTVLKRVALSQGFDLQKCIYDEGEQKRILRRLVRETIKTPSLNAASRRLARRLEEIVPVLKDPSFAEEREWRLISSLKAPLQDGRDYREGASTVVPHFRLPFLGHESEMLSRVIVGPAADRQSARAARAAISSLLADRGFSGCKVEVSTIPLRAGT